MNREQIASSVKKGRGGMKALHSTINQGKILHIYWIHSSVFFSSISNSIFAAYTLWFELRYSATWCHCCTRLNLAMFDAVGILGARNANILMRRERKKKACWMIYACMDRRTTYKYALVRIYRLQQYMQSIVMASFIWNTNLSISIHHSPGSGLISFSILECLISSSACCCFFSLFILMVNLSKIVSMEKGM